MPQTVSKVSLTKSRVGTAYSFPIPWHKTLQNIFVNLYLFWSVSRAQGWKELHQGLKSRGIPEPVTVLNVYESHAPVLVSQFPESEYPIDYSSIHIKPVGPIYKSFAPVASVDPDLATWLARKPTVLINLGSHMHFNAERTRAISTAISLLLRERQVQVLWKYRPEGPVPETSFSAIEDAIADKTVRLEKWLAADPAALLETGHVVLMVHHGGASSFNEALGSGVPAVVIPLWFDCFDYAVRAEWLGVGIWGTRKYAPVFQPEELASAMIRATGDGEEAVGLRDKVRKFRDLVALRGQGRDVAAREIVKYMDLLEQGEGVQSSRERDEL